MVLVLGGLMLMVGVAFKLSAVPFHFWAPDVFEGATAEVAAFLSVASKAAALGLLVRLATGFSFRRRPRRTLAALAPVRHYIGTLISRAGRGDLHLRQPGRLWADEHEAAAGLFHHRPCRLHDDARGGGRHPDRHEPGRGPRRPSPSLVVYISIYLFMNLAAFAIVAFLRNADAQRRNRRLRRPGAASPGLTVCMAIVMFSLVGLPPLAGFPAKLTIFVALVAGPSLDPAVDRGIEHGAEPVLLSAGREGDDLFAPSRCTASRTRIPLSSVAGSYCRLADRARRGVVLPARSVC